MVLIATLALAFGNGANDNFKGFATVWGSATLTYRRALRYATVATVAGSLASVWLANGLLLSFSGKGLVPDSVASAPSFLLSVALGAAVTVQLASRLGLPVSTTHALIGGLIGAGLGQGGESLNWAPLVKTFVIPLLLSPLLAALLSALARRLFDTREAVVDCACVVVDSKPMLASTEGIVARSVLLNVVIATDAACAPLNPIVKVSTSRLLDGAHQLSAVSICFARGLNDTPKVAALLLAQRTLGAHLAIYLIAATMALGGLLFAKRVAHTMSRRISLLNHRDGLAANLTTAAIVLLASRFGLPVSTTHVAVGAIAGVGASGGTLNGSALRGILLAWVATLPLAAAFAYMAARLA